MTECICILILDKKKNVLTIVIVTVSVFCGICSVIVFLILRRRKQNGNQHAGKFYQLLSYYSFNGEKIF